LIFYELVAIKYNTCIIIPTISPFGLDGNNTKSLSPFDIKGKGRTKIFSFLERHSDVHTPPEYLLKSLNELPLCIFQGVPMCPCYMLKALLLLNCVVHAPPDYRKDLKKMFFKKNQDLYIIKDLPITKRLPSPNQVGIIHPTKWGYIRNMTTKYITSSS